MEKAKNYKNEEMFCIKFIGKEPGDENVVVPIYELGQILVSFQQIIYKTFTYNNDGHMSNEEREKLSLQFASRQKGSDIYSFSTFLLDPVIQAFLAPFVEKAISTILEYASGTVNNSLKAGRSPDEYISAIFPQLLNIVECIKSDGGFCRIKIYVPDKISVDLDMGTKEAVKACAEGNVFYGDELEIKGIVNRFFKDKNIVLVETKENGNVKVYLKEEEILNIRQKTQRNTIITFKAKPRFQFGKESYLKREEFEATSISI